jgi:hypothetical protein
MGDRERTDLNSLVGLPITDIVSKRAIEDPLGLAVVDIPAGGNPTAFS